jgi:hypothetical protein
MSGKIGQAGYHVDLTACPPELPHGTGDVSVGIRVGADEDEVDVLLADDRLQCVD